LTVALINSDKNEAAILAIEFWTSLCEVEIERNSKNIPHKQILSRCYQSLLDIIFMALQKPDDFSEDPELNSNDDDTEWTLRLAAACALEHLAQVIRDDILEPVLSFI
jgi:importin subunit beta-1